MERGRTFEGVAALYDAHRRGYPAALFDDLMDMTGLASGDSVLEIGCGSGHATAGFLDRGLDVTAIDPGAPLVALARERFAAAPNVRFAVSPFEAWPLSEHKFRLVAAAQSLHWVQPHVRFAKTAQALAPGGHLAVFGHTPRWSGELLARLEPVYRRAAPELWDAPGENWYLPDGPLPALFAESGRFAPVRQRAYAWSRQYSPREFVSYLGTRSDHNLLAKERRHALLAEVEEALPDAVTGDWATNLYLAAAR